MKCLAGWDQFSVPLFLSVSGLGNSKIAPTAPTSGMPAILIPEPSSVFLALLGSFMLLRRHGGDGMGA